jgi:hypothetical protein
LKTEPAITWVKIERPFFDLGGVLIASLEIVGSLLIAALLLGGFFGLLLLWKRRRETGPPIEATSLRLQTPS